MLIFLDVGAHEGQTLDEVVDARYGFDEIYAFEPMPQELAVLTARFADDARVVICPFGLLDRTCDLPIYGTNARMEASVFAAKNDLVDPGTTTLCEFRAASEFIAGLPSEATIIVKLNCEGSETLILNDLAATGMIHRLHHVLVDFDVRKIPGEEWREADCLGRLVDVGFDRYSIADEVMHGPTHLDRTRAWLQPVMP